MLQIAHVQFDFVRHYLLNVDAFRILSLTQKLVLIHVFYRGIVGNTRCRAKHFPLFLCIELHVFSHLWPWSYQTHLALQYIQQLGQFIHLSLAEKVANMSDSLIMFSHGEQSFVVGTDAHRTEFVESEGLAVFPYALLDVETATLASQLDFQTDGSKDGCEYDQSKSREYDVEESDQC